MSSNAEFRPALSVLNPRVRGAVEALAVLFFSLTINQVVDVACSLNTPPTDFLVAVTERYQEAQNN